MRKLISLVAFTVAVGVVPASGYVSNDAPQSPTVITSLPFSDTVAMASEATAEQGGFGSGACDDQSYFVGSVNLSNPLSRFNTVWYRYAATEEIVVHASTYRPGDTSHGMVVTRRSESFVSGVGCFDADDHGLERIERDRYRSDARITVSPGDELTFSVYAADFTDIPLTFTLAEAIGTDLSVTELLVHPVTDGQALDQTPLATGVTVRIAADVVHPDARRQIHVRMCNASDCWRVADSFIEEVAANETYRTRTPWGCQGRFRFTAWVEDPYGADPDSSNDRAVTAGSVLRDNSWGSCVWLATGEAPPPPTT